MIGQGTVLEDRYEVIRLLARGGAAEVFLATDRTLQRPVALKVVHLARADDHERLEREARLIARFEHPNLVRIFGAHHTDEEAYVVLEYVQGPTLAHVVAGGALGKATTAHIGAQVADALAFVHEQGVVHRDVKPSNVFVGDDGRTRLSDFGIARHDDDTHLTQTGMVIGTGAYMAPEQVEARDVTAAADIYSLGLVLLECLTGTAAFAGAPSEAALARLARQPDIPTLSAPWPRLLASMTARDPSERPSAADVAAQLRGAPPATGIAATAVVAEPVVTTSVVPSEVSATDVFAIPATTGHRARSRRGPLVATIAVAVLAALAALALTRVGDDGSNDSGTTTTTVAGLSPTTGTTAPTTTVDACTRDQAARNALAAQEEEIDQALKGRAAQDAKREIQAHKKALDEALKSC